jgi:hypothetical protein|tara:strand:+ start:2742 stop:2990 length:249 start_codon:yes stop_codon:yes gene_type:complete
MSRKQKVSELTKEQKKELQKLADDMTQEAKKVRLDYKENPSDMSGSVHYVHENSPFLREKHERLIKIDGKELKIKPDTKEKA